MERKLGSHVLAGLLLLAVTGFTQAPLQSLTITYLYDNTARAEGTKAHWGFSCLVQGNGSNLLFDAGANADTLRANLATLHIDLSRVNALVLSHEHTDHTGGLAAAGRLPGVPVFFPSSFGERTRSAFIGQALRLMPVSKATDIAAGFATSDEMGAAIHEQALVADTRDGLVVIVGCSHPGIVSMLRQISAARKKQILMVVGGFHLLQTPEDEVKRIVGEFKTMGISYAGPTHCTGESAMQLFRAAYGERFITGGVGMVVRVPLESGK